MIFHCIKKTGILRNLIKLFVILSLQIIDDGRLSKNFNTFHR